jgi:hypothetical protein
MERLRALVQRPFSEPLSYGQWRRWMREYMHPDSNPETAQAAWQHFDDRNKQNMAAFVDRFRAGQEASRARGTPPLGSGEM